MALTVAFGPVGWVYLAADAEVTMENALDALRKVYADRRFVEPMRILWDLREGAQRLGAEDVRRVVAFVRAYEPPVRRRAAIVVADQVAYGMGRMYGILVSDRLVEVRPFRSVEGARAWLEEPF